MTSSKPIKTIIWDWNGTLLNDTKLCFDLLNLLLREQGIKELKTVEEYKSIFGFPIKDYYARAGLDFNKVSFEVLAQQYIDQYSKLVCDCALFDGTIDVLSEIKRRGIRQIILSASKQGLLEQQVEMFGISQYFDELVGTSDIYAASKISTALRWRERSSIIGATLIGDTVHDFEVATALDADCVLCSNGHHTAKQLLHTGATIIADITEVLKLI